MAKLTLNKQVTCLSGAIFRKNGCIRCCLHCNPKMREQCTEVCDHMGDDCGEDRTYDEATKVDELIEKQLRHMDKRLKEVNKKETVVEHKKYKLTENKKIKTDNILKIEGGR